MQYTTFAPGSSEVAAGFLGFFFFSVFLFIIYPNCACRQLFLGSDSLHQYEIQGVFCCSRCLSR